MLLLLTVGACALRIPQADLDSITYDYQQPPFCGRCETRKVTVTADDSIWIEDGHWAGHYSDWRIRRRTIQGEPGTYARFRDALAPWRVMVDRSPSYEGEGCISDDGGAILTWATSSDSVRRSLDHGCPADRVILDAVEAIVAVLPDNR
jgi:hypothetical protein